MAALQALDPTLTGAFLVAAILLTLAPGPDNLMVLSLALARGRRDGVLFGLGAASGTVFHTLLAVMGIGAVIAASPAAFGGIRIAGAFYLAWLGAQIFRHLPVDGSRIGPASVSVEESGHVFLKGMGASAINPKVIVFFLAFLPQFVTPERGEIRAQMLALGLLFALQGAVIFSMIGFFAGTLGQRMARNPKIRLTLTVIAGLVFWGLAVHLLFESAASAIGK